MKKSFIIFLLFWDLSGFTQSYSADSLKLLLKSEKEDTSIVLLLAKLSESYLYNNPDSSFYFAQKGYALSRKINYIKGEASSLRNLGVILDMAGDYPTALEQYFQALKKFESLNDFEGMIRLYADIGTVYSEQGDYTTDILYTTKSKTLAESIGRPDLALFGFLNLGDNYEKRNKLDSARIHTNQAFELAVRYNKIFISGITLNNLGNIYSKMRQRNIAMSYYQQSLSIFKNADDHEGICESTLGMAKLFAEAKQADSLLYYSRFSLATANESGFTKRILDAASFLTNYFKGLKLVDSAWHYQEITMAAKDSLFSQEKVRKVQNLNFLEQIRQQEIAEAKRQAQEKRKERIQMLGVGTFITFFFGILILFSKWTKKRKIIRFLGLIGVLLLFEFIAYLLDPLIVILSHGIPVLNLLFLVILASFLVPLDSWLEDWVNEKLAPDSN